VTDQNNHNKIFWHDGLKKDLPKKNGGWNPTWPKSKELIRFKDLIKLLIGLIGLIKYLIEKTLSLKVNLDKIRRIN
jgi:hypothetical protein